MSEADAGTKLRALGWHQGAVIPLHSGGPLVGLCRPGFDHAVIASQDCDIVASVTTEPNVDLIPGMLQCKPEGSLQHGKHPRRLCLALGDERFLLIDVRHRITAPKNGLFEIAPIHELAPTFRERRLLAKWLGKRYKRDAFPDAFNERLRANSSKLERLAKKLASADISAIFLTLNRDEELAPNDPYRVVIWFACRREVADDPGKRATLETFAADFAKALNACDGIEVEEHELRALYDITLEDIEHLKRFDYDFRSEAPKPGGETTDAD